LLGPLGTFWLANDRLAIPDNDESWSPT